MSPVKKIKTYTITVTEREDGTTIMERDSDGLSRLELIGLINLIKNQIEIDALNEMYNNQKQSKNEEKINQ